MITIKHQDALDFLRELPDASLDALVTDPPSGIAFMGKSWDRHNTYTPRTAKGTEALRLLSLLGLKAWEVGFVAFMLDIMSQSIRVLKPGSHGLVWALPRTSDLTCLALRLAGFEIRDSIHHHFGSGFPKSHDVSKGIDAHLGVEREVVGGRTVASDKWTAEGREALDRGESSYVIPTSTPTTPQAKRWEGWGSAIKPSHEVWWLIRKPLTGTLASNVMAWGVGGLNIDACRVQGGERVNIVPLGKTGNVYGSGLEGGTAKGTTTQGRWPPNTLFTHSASCTDTTCAEDCPVGELARQSGVRKSGAPVNAGKVGFATPPNPRGLRERQGVATSHRGQAPRPQADKSSSATITPRSKAST